MPGIKTAASAELLFDRVRLPCSNRLEEGHDPRQPPRTARAAFFGRAAAVVTARSKPVEPAKVEASDQPAKPSSVSPDLDVVQKSKGPVMTAIDEFFKMGPGPSSSHTIGSMRITYHFYQRISRHPADELNTATGLKVHLFGSVSATGKGHSTNRAALAGLLGQAPAACPPQFLDRVVQRPDEAHKLTLGPTSVNRMLKDVIFDDTKGQYPHPNTMRILLLAGNNILYEQEHRSVGGSFIEGKGYKPLDKGQPKYPYTTA